MPNTIQQEVDDNYEAFESLLPVIVHSHRGQYALMRNREILGFYSSASDAGSAGNLAFKDGLFSIQHVTETAIHLGFYTDAVLSHHVQPDGGADDKFGGTPA